MGVGWGGGGGRGKERGRWEEGLEDEAADRFGLIDSTDEI